MNYAVFFQFPDVTFGSILGFVVMYVTFQQYYPPLSNPQCHLPLYSFLGGDVKNHGDGVENSRPASAALSENSEPSTSSQAHAHHRNNKNAV